jgi:dsRNA-specific ribonuclease
MNLTLLEQKLGYTFQQPSLLEHALIHKSYGHEKLTHLDSSERDNERCGTLKIFE